MTHDPVCVVILDELMNSVNWSIGPKGECRPEEKESISPVRELYWGKRNFFARLHQDYSDPPGSPIPLPPGGTASRGLSLNRSQYGGCSTKYNTPAGTQVVCRRFGGEQAVFPESSQTELKPEQ